jgi:hypothetical protein
LSREEREWRPRGNPAKLCAFGQWRILRPLIVRPRGHIVLRKLFIGQEKAPAAGPDREPVEFAQDLRVCFPDEVKVGVFPNFFTIHVLPPARLNAELNRTLGRKRAILLWLASTMMISNHSAKGEAHLSAAQRLRRDPGIYATVRDF